MSHVLKIRRGAEWSASVTIKDKDGGPSPIVNKTIHCWIAFRSTGIEVSSIVENANQGTVSLMIDDQETEKIPLGQNSKLYFDIIDADGNVENRGTVPVIGV